MRLPIKEAACCLATSNDTSGHIGIDDGQRPHGFGLACRVGGSGLGNVCTCVKRGGVGEGGEQKGKRWA